MVGDKSGRGEPNDEGEKFWGEEEETGGTTPVDVFSEPSTLAKKSEGFGKLVFVFWSIFSKIMLSYKQMKIKPLLLILFLGLPIATFISYHLAFYNRIFPGIYLCQTNLGNKTKSEAEKILSQLISSEKISTKTVYLIYQNEAWPLNLADLEFKILVPESVERSFRVGRENDWWKNFVTRLKLWRKGEKLSYQYYLNQSKLENQIATISAKIYIPAVNPQIKIIKNSSGQKEIKIEPGRNGLEVDQKKLFSIIGQKLSCLDTSSSKIPVASLSPKYSAEPQKIIKRAEGFIDKNIKIFFENQSWELNDQSLVDFLSSNGGFEEEKINHYLESLKNLVERNPENAFFQMENDRVLVFKPAKDGILLDRKKTKEIFYSALNELENNQDLKIKEITLVVNRIPPKIKTEDVNNLGIKELIGSGKSQFKGSIAQRIHNIKLAAEKLNGFVVAPGETFSFNQALGEVSENTGFQKAYIIKEGRTILGDGGGVCQVSTTLFRAILNAGLSIEERHPHAYRVSYYEQDSQPGFDATVFDPSADLKFKNDTQAHILIQSRIDFKNKTLVFELYGTSDGRKVEIGKAYVWDIVSPPPDLYQDDPNLPVGTIKQIDWKAWGAKVKFTWKVTRGGKVLQDKTFYSNYRPWQAIFLRGTKTY